MDLSIAEGFYLIALDDEEGRILSSAERTVVPGIVSGSIIELLIQKKVEINQGIVRLKGSLPNTGNTILDKVLEKMKDGEEFTKQITRISNSLKDIEEDLNHLLQQRGILRKEETKLLWIPLSERMDNANYAYEASIREELKEIALRNKKPSPEQLALLNIIVDCNVLDEVFHDKDELIDAEKRTKDLLGKGASSFDPQLIGALQILRGYFKK